MTNDHPHTVPVVINGTERVLKLGPKALRIARDKHGVRVSLAEMADLDLDSLARFTWIGLLPDDPTLTLDAFVDELEESGDMFTVFAATGEAIKNLTGAGPKGKGGNGKAGKGR